MSNVPLQNNIAVLLGILTGACDKLGRSGSSPTTANALLEKNLMRGSVVMIYVGPMIKSAETVINTARAPQLL